MQTAQILNLEPKQENSQPADEIKRTDDTLEQTQSEIRRLRTRLERQEDQQDSHTRRTKVLAAVLGILAVTLAGALWSVYPALQGQQKTAVDVLGLRKGASTLGEHVQMLETQLGKASANLPALSQRMDQLSTGMKSGFQNARTQAQAAATQVGDRIREEVNRSLQMIQSRLTALESNQHEASGRTNELEAQIAGLKLDLSKMREQSVAAEERIKQLQDDQQARAATLTTLDQKMASHQTTIDSLSNRIDSKRVGFELQNHRTEEIAPEIYLTITRADMSKQQIDATLQLGAKSQMLPIRAQAIQRPVSFYSGNDGRPTEVVFTNVGKNQVSGYLVMPATPIQAQ